MGTYFARRFLMVIPTLIGVTFIVFMITRFVPGGPVEQAIQRMRFGGGAGEGGQGAGNRGGNTGLTDAQIESLKKQFGFDKPAPVAYLIWLSNTARLDLGKSYFQHKPVTTLIAERLPISLTFGLTGFFAAYLVCVPLGIYKAVKHGGFFDFASSVAVFIGYSIPAWAFGLLLILLLASGRFYDVMPLGGLKSSTYESLPQTIQDAEPREKVVDKYGLFAWERLSPRSKLIDTVWHMVLPVFCYMLGSFATLTLLTKNSLMDNLGQDYVRTAFAKGLSPRRVILLHAMRNSLIPLATGLGHAIGIIMTGAFLIEYTFSIDGLGLLGYTSLINRDYTVVMGTLTISTVLVLVGNILSDVLYALIDPRIRFE